jgi:rhodanese-related sulfurtransferase
MIKKGLGIVLTALLSLSLAGCSQPQVLQPETSKEGILKSVNYDVIIDLRDEEAYNTIHLESAVNMPYNEDTFALDVKDFDPTTDYLFYGENFSQVQAALTVLYGLKFTGELYNAGGFQQAYDLLDVKVVRPN